MVTSDGPIIRVLGPVRLGARHLTPLEQHVLALLAAGRGRMVPVDRLVDGLWPTSPPASARNRVHSIISSLRRSLPDATLVTQRQGYVLHADDTVLDSRRFERVLRQARELRGVHDTAAAMREFERALQLWSGNAYEGVPSDGSVAHEAGRLGELRFQALEDLFELRLTAGAGAISEPADLADLASFVDEQPLRPRPRGLLMTALHRAGRQAEALEVYRAGAALLAAEHGLDPSPALRDLHEAILRDQSAPVDAPAPAHVTVPRQIPASPADFTGRRKELRLIRALVEDTDPKRSASSVVVSISGMAGVGKTTLAVRVAHDLSARFPGGCLYADLHGAESPASPALALGAFLRACGVSGDAIPSTVDERAALYRSLLAERDMLVVLDNAAGEEQVRPLLPGAGGTVLLTSRRPLTGLPGAQLIRLEVLPVQDAIDLLAAVAGKDRVATDVDAAQRIATLCGGLPLAVRVVAMRLAANDNLSLGRLGDRLADERERLDELALADLDVRASLALSSGQLTPQEALVWQALCVLPLESIPVWLVASMLAVSAGRAHRLLETLGGAQLITMVEPDRYRIHDLIRLLGRELAALRAPGEISALTDRACGDLLAQVRLANAALPCRPVPAPAGDGTHAPMWTDDAGRFLDLELGNALSVIRFAVARGETALAAELAACLTNFCLMRGYTDQWEHSLRMALPHTGPLDPVLRAMVELGIGTLKRFNDNNRAALPHLRRAARLLHGGTDREAEASALLSWGVTARMLGRTHAARRANAAALGLLERLPGPSVHLGYALLAQHQLDHDPVPLERASAVFESLGEDWGAAEAHMLLGARARERGDLTASANHANAAMAAYGRTGDRMNLVAAELQLARIHLARAEHRKALPILNRALRSAQETRHPWTLATAHRLLGQLLLEQDDAAQALTHLNTSVSVLREIGQPLPMALSLEQLARAHHRLGDGDRALSAGREALAILSRLRQRAAEPLAEWLATVRPH